MSKSTGLFVCFHFKLSDSLVMTCRNVEHLGVSKAQQGRDRVIISTETTANTLASFQS